MSLLAHSSHPGPSYQLSSVMRLSFSAPAEHTLLPTSKRDIGRKVDLSQFTSEKSIIQTVVAQCWSTLYGGGATAQPALLNSRTLSPLDSLAHSQMTSNRLVFAPYDFFAPVFN